MKRFENEWTGAQGLNELQTMCDRLGKEGWQVTAVFVKTLGEHESEWGAWLTREITEPTPAELPTTPPPAGYTAG